MGTERLTKEEASARGMRMQVVHARWGCDHEILAGVLGCRIGDIKAHASQGKASAYVWHVFEVVEDAPTAAAAHARMRAWRRRHCTRSPSTPEQRAPAPEPPAPTPAALPPPKERPLWAPGGALHEVLMEHQRGQPAADYADTRRDGRQMRRQREETTWKPQRARCESCGAEIWWAHTSNGEWMPVDAAPVENGNLWLERDEQAQIVRVHYASKARPRPEGKRAFCAHFVTCTHASHHRKTG